jgi:NDP-sugar pyrophosphorylase family protein
MVMRKRISVMLDSKLVKKLDEMIDGVEIRNRSHAVEKLIGKALGEQELNKALVFAGGGKITVGNSKTVKPMVRVLGKPILEYVIEELKRNGIEDISLAVTGKSPEIREFFGDGSMFGVRLRYIVEREPLGTEGALANALKFMDDAPFCAVNGDGIFKLNLKEMYLQHLETKALVTVALVPMIEPFVNYFYTNFGVTKLEGFKIVEFTENPKVLEGNELFSAGIYVIDPKVANYITVPMQKTALEESLFPKLARMGKLYAFLHSGPWYSLDNDADLGASIKKMAEVANKLYAP